MDTNDFVLTILGAVISVPYDLSLFYPLIQYQRQKIRAEQIPTRMYISFLITSTIVSARNVILFDTNTGAQLFIMVASVSLTIIFISTIWLFRIKFRNHKTKILMLILLLIGSVLLMIAIFIIVGLLKYHQRISSCSIGITAFQIVTTIIILINTIVPFPFDNFTQCDYKKVPLVTVISGILDNIGWIVITITVFTKKLKNDSETDISIDTLSFIANGGSFFFNIVHVLFYIYWKCKSDKKIDYTIVTEIK